MCKPKSKEAEEIREYNAYTHAYNWVKKSKNKEMQERRKGITYKSTHNPEKLRKIRKYKKQRRALQHKLKDKIIYYHKPSFLFSKPRKNMSFREHWYFLLPLLSEPSIIITAFEKS